MKNNFLNNFRFYNQKEDFDKVILEIENGIEFKGTNLWILILAIFIASLGLNVNSTAVIIGAMLISPLMGPIMAMGLALSINDLIMLRKAAMNFTFAVGVSLATSSIYFLISPISEAHSELLARTSPTIYDVLIALFGGAAGVIALSSKLKGNVIPGVAIATALMPPLCTAGYGIATLQFSFIFGAAFLFTINTVFIALATLLVTKFLNFPEKSFIDSKKQKRNQRIIWFITLATLIPSIYFGYKTIEQNNFQNNSEKFIDEVCVFDDNFLLKKEIDPLNKTIKLTYVGHGVEREMLAKAKYKLPLYKLKGTELVIVQGVDLGIVNQPVNFKMLKKLEEKQILIKKYELLVDSLKHYSTLSEQIVKELQVNFPTIEGLTIAEPSVKSNGGTSRVDLMVVISIKDKLPKKEYAKLVDFMKIRLGNDSIEFVIKEIN